MIKGAAIEVIEGGGGCEDAGTGRSRDSRVVPRSLGEPGALDGRERPRWIGLDRIDRSDHTFCYRINLDVEPLARDLERNDQHFPVVLRALDGHDKLQLVCGFRRVGALERLGRTRVKGVIRRLTDDEALHLAWSENELHRSTSSLDRAHAILKAHRSGKTMESLQQLFGLSRKQLTRLKKLALMPHGVQQALALGTITSTHAVVLNDLHLRYPGLDLGHWIEQITDQRLSVRALRYRINRQYADVREKPPLLTESGDAVYLRAAKLEPAKLSDRDRAELREVARRLAELAEA